MKRFLKIEKYIIRFNGNKNAIFFFQVVKIKILI